MRDHQRRHPQFPTIAEVQKDPTLAYSDHLLTAYTAKLPDKSPINILSLNTLGFNGFSGLHQGRQWESEQQCQQRYMRIAEGLMAAATRHDTGIIALQEVSSEIMLPILKKVFGQQWNINENSKSGLITLYFNDVLEQPSVEYDDDKRTISSQFRLKETGVSFTIHNVWSAFNAVPCATEAYYQTLLDQPDTQIIVGDTNSRIAPLHNRVENITTGIVPVFFNDDAGIDDSSFQRVDFPDGAFQSVGEKIVQLERTVLDFGSGEIIENPPLDADALQSDYKMLLCLDYSYAAQQITPGHTLFDYQQKLQETYHDYHLVVRMAANHYNEKAVAITFSSQNAKLCHNKLQAKYADHPAIIFTRILDEETSRNDPCVFIPLDLIPELSTDLLPQANAKSTSTGTKVLFAASTVTGLGAAGLGLWATLASASLGHIAILGGLSVLSAIIWPLAITAGVIALGTGLYLLNKNGCFDGTKQKLFGSTSQQAEDGLDPSSHEYKQL